MPVPLNGLAKNFKAIDITSNGNGNNYSETSSSTSSISSPSNYMRPQGLNNSNTSTMSSRSKLVSNSSSSVNSSSGIKNFQHISSGSYSKLKSKFNKENNNSSPSSATINNNNSNTPELKSIVDSSSQNFSTIKESFKNLERSESQTLLNARNPNYKTMNAVSSTVPSSKQGQYLTMPLKKSRNTNSNNNFSAMIDTIEPLTPTATPVCQNKRLDSEAESSSSLLLSLSSMSSYASIKDNCKQTSSKSSSSTSSCENEPSMATVSDKIKKLSNENSSSSMRYNQQQEQAITKRQSTYSSTSSLAVKSSKHPEEPTGICSNHSLSSVSVFNSDTSSSPSSTSPNSNKAQMPFKIRSSKYRHVYGNPHKEDVCYKNIKITKNAAHDSAFCAVNPKFVAVVTEECGGGAFIVIPIKHTGRIDINTPKVSGHRGPVLDLKWNPFNDNEIASCSEDTTIKVWQIGDHGLYENLNDWVVDLHGHQRRVGQIEWHPTAENIMLSSGADFQVILWNLEKAEPIRVITCHNDTIQSMSWNRDGSLFATTCKDKKIRLINPRTGVVVSQGEGHQGSKISKCIILGCGTKLFTTGFSRLSERQIGLWNLKDLSKPIQIDVVDCSSGILIPYYDNESKIVFVAGKGDGNIRYYELTDSDPYIHYLSEYKSSAPQRGLGSIPKRGLDVTKNEIFRFYKLHATGGICEPISMIVPRKSEVFQEDIYPDTPSGIPSLSCDEWIMGENRDPILMSMKDGAVPFMPKIVTYKQLGCPEIGNNYSRSLLNGNKQTFVNLNRKNSNGSGGTTPNKKRPSNGIEADYRSNLPVAEVQPNTKLVVSSRSAFNKTSSSSSSYSSSPPASPNQTKKFTNNKLVNGGSKILNGLEMPITNSSSSEATNRDSSNESMVMMQNGYLIEDTNSYTNNLFQTINTSLNEDGTCSNHDLIKQNNHNNNTNEEIETSYLTSVSKNPITLRKTESLKLDSVQSIRNRFNRMNNIGSLTRHSITSATAITNRNSDHANHSFSNSNSNSSENLNQSNNRLSMSNESEPPIQAPQPIILSPLAYSTTNTSNKLTTMTSAPLLLASANGITSNNGIISSTTSYQEYFDMNTGLSSGSSSLMSNGVKKRVWTPVQPNSLGRSHPNGKLSNDPAFQHASQNNLSELQKSYFKLLEEKNNFKEQLTSKQEENRQLKEELELKDKRINQLENKLNSLMNINNASNINSNVKRIDLIDATTDC